MEELTGDLRQQYQSLFNSCVINPAQQAAVNTTVARIMPTQARYQAVAAPLNIPWFFVAVIHNMECSLRFNCHLHNGDPLTARTVHDPPGRPPNGNPPFSWEQSATDALTSEGFAQLSDWSLPAVLYRLEKYNGFGYRKLTPSINTPYLWSFSNHYTSGKFISDRVFDPNAASTQCGAAVILFQMAKNGVVAFAAAVAAAAAPAPGPVSSSPSPPSMTASQLAAQFDNAVTFSNSEASDAARALQNALNAFPGIHLKADGVPGRQTSDAYQQITGHFLKGDPLASS